MVLLHLKRAVGNPYGAGGQNGAGGGFHGGFGGFDFGQGGNGYHEYHFENSNMGDMGDIFEISLEICSMVRKTVDTVVRAVDLADRAFTVVSEEADLEGHTQEKAVTSGLEVSISFEDAAFGCDKMIRLSDPSEAVPRHCRYMFRQVSKMARASV